MYIDYSIKRETPAQVRDLKVSMVVSAKPGKDFACNRSDVTARCSATVRIEIPVVVQYRHYGNIFGNSGGFVAGTYRHGGVCAIFAL